MATSVSAARRTAHLAARALLSEAIGAPSVSCLRDGASREAFYHRQLRQRRHGSSEAGPTTSAPLRPAPQPSCYDASPDWRDWFQSIEYENVWHDLKPLPHPPLDKSTRFLCGLLDDLYQGGQRRYVDRVTTARCNKAIRQLSDLSLGGKILEGRAQRADSILTRMHKCSALRSRELKHELPHPNRETYFLVLKCFAVTQGPRSVAERAEEIIRVMQDGGKFDLRPDAIIWNQVLSCWAVSVETDKAYHAAALLSRIRNLADASSYGQALRACAFSDLNERSKRLGSEVASRVWKDMEKSTDVAPTSHAFAYYIRACGYSTDRESRDRALEPVFARCCESGMVDSHVLDQFNAVASDALFERVMQDVALTKTDESRLSGASLMNKVPRKWTRNASMKNNLGE